MIAVVKMRGSQHDKSLRLYEVTGHGLVLGDTLTDYSGIITGVARRAYGRDAQRGGPVQPAQ